MNLRGFRATNLSAYDFLPYKTLPHISIKEKRIDLI